MNYPKKLRSIKNHAELMCPNQTFFLVIQIQAGFGASLATPKLGGGGQSLLISLVVPDLYINYIYMAKVGGKVLGTEKKHTPKSKYKDLNFQFSFEQVGEIYMFQQVKVYGKKSKRYSVSNVQFHKQTKIPQE